MPGEPLSFTIDASLPLARLDVVLHKRLPEVSRAAIQRLLGQGHIRVNGRKVKPAHHPRAGEVVTVEWPEPIPAAARAEAIPLEILFEDDSLLVINKPAGLVVHPGAGHLEHTLVNALLHHCAGRLSGIGGQARPGIVHRLDKDTSGCLVVAKTDAAHLALSEQFSNRQVEKLYRAVACGRIARDSGRIESSISRHPTQRRKMAVTSRAGREARSSYRVLERWQAATLVEVAIHTGRTHQIRVHLAHLRHPVVGDLVYGRRANTFLREKTGFSAPRQLLHASRLALIHPISKRQISIEAPLPADFSNALDFFRQTPQN